MVLRNFPGHGQNVERAIWEGKALPAEVTCACGDCEKRHRPNTLTPIIKSAAQHRAGSETFFYTDFSRAFSTQGDKEKEIVFGGCNLHAQLGSQSVLPQKIPEEATSITGRLHYRLEGTLSSPRLVIEGRGIRPPPAGEKPTPSSYLSLPLYKLDMPADGSLRLRSSFRALTKTGVFIYVQVSGRKHDLPSAPGADACVVDTVIQAPPSTISNPRLEEIGIRLNPLCTDCDMTRLAEVDFICIQHVALRAPLQFNHIFGIHIKSRGGEETHHLRLCWSSTSDGQPTTGMPHSGITGCFSFLR